MGKRSLVVTSIAGSENAVLRGLSSSSSSRGITFIVIGDVSSPAEFALEGCDYYSIGRQEGLGFALSQSLPVRHYARKNIGYLVAMRGGAEVIQETDDDNIPYGEFWEVSEEVGEVGVYEGSGWTNVYKLFTNEAVWPRGFSLAHIKEAVTPPPLMYSKGYKYPIRQGLADANPDVDAVYRLTGVLPVKFAEDKTRLVGLGRGSWCPFNSQNTVWYAEAYGLLYLPSYCSFRMTDIWRSFVAQRICWENDWGVLFHHATVSQERNDHNLLGDFADEVVGYLHNGRIVEELEKLSLRAGVEHVGENMLVCYEQFIRMGLVDKKELGLIKDWIDDISNCGVVCRVGVGVGVGKRGSGMG
ncbi:MAG: STELLO glycosyltransferase family protein [Tannerellaceae bacterium]|jgi:hypothetical protein|nr:STELLO glycosyltransferase family protein [Tannerellaceae bacterium]